MAVPVIASVTRRTRGQQAREVGAVGAVEGVLDGADLVPLGEERGHQRHDRALELRARLTCDREGGEGLPGDHLAGVGGDEEGDAGPEAVAVDAPGLGALQEVVQEHDHDAGRDELEDDEGRVQGAKLRGDVAVHARKDVRDGLAGRDEQGQELLHAVVERLVLLDVRVDRDELRGIGPHVHDKCSGSRREAPAPCPRPGPAWHSAPGCRRAAA